jgi:hypothetical protein
MFAEKLENIKNVNSQHQQIQSTGSEKLNIASSLQGKSGHA